MIGFIDILVEMALRKSLANVLADASPVTYMLKCLPTALGTLPTKLVTNLLAKGKGQDPVLIKSGFSMEIDAGLRPTISISVTSSTPADPGPNPLGMGTRMDPATGKRVSAQHSRFFLNIHLLSTNRDDVRVLAYFVKSTMLDFTNWLVGTGRVDNIMFAGSDDMLPDDSWNPEGPPIYMHQLRWAFSAMENIGHLTAFSGTLAEFVVVSEAGTTVTAVPDSNTSTYQSLGASIPGGATPDEE